MTVAVGAEAPLWALLHPGPTSTFAERTNPLGPPGALGSFAAWMDDHGGVVAVPVYGASLASLVVRFRRSRGIERQQLKLLPFAGAVPVVAFAISFMWSPLVGEGFVNDAIFVTASHRWR